MCCVARETSDQAEIHSPFAEISLSSAQISGDNLSIPLDMFARPATGPSNTRATKKSLLQELK